jgi:hypothetical protein
MHQICAKAKFAKFRFKLDKKYLFYLIINIIYSQVVPMLNVILLKHQVKCWKIGCGKKNL